MTQGQGYLDWFHDGEVRPLFFTDNMSTLSVAKSTITTKKSKHMLLRFHMVRDHVRDLCWVPTDKNLADPLTKALTGGKYLNMFKVAAGHELPEDNDDDEDYEAHIGVCCYASVVSMPW
jgi:hypothetical protein